MNFMQMMSSITPVSSAASSTVASALGTKRAKPMDTPATGSTDGSAAATAASGSSAITSSDFLTLLVSELKNQDPTQPTDPNQYITQLVGVNSLQQLIGINQGITSLAPTATTTSAISSPVGAPTNPSPTPGP